MTVFRPALMAELEYLDGRLKNYEPCGIPTRYGELCVGNKNEPSHMHRTLTSCVIAWQSGRTEQIDVRTYGWETAGRIAAALATGFHGLSPEDLARIAWTHTRAVIREAYTAGFAEVEGDGETYMRWQRREAIRAQLAEMEKSS